MTKKPTVKKVVVGQHGDGSFVRLLLPEPSRACAPCCLEHNLCCEGVCCAMPPFPANRPSIHLLPTGALTYPALAWLRSRISEQDWTEFIAALDAANLRGTALFASCDLFPCACPCLPLQPCCCWMPYQYMEGKRLEGDAALNLAVAKFNRYLFAPRGMLVRRQQEEYKLEDGERIRLCFLRVDLIPSAQAQKVQQAAMAYAAPVEPLDIDREGAPSPPPSLYESLPYGLVPGTMRFDIRKHTRKEWIASSLHRWPCWDQDERFFAMPLLIPEPRYFLDGTEPEVEDAAMLERYAPVNEQVFRTGPGQFGAARGQRVGQRVADPGMPPIPLAQAPGYV